MEGVLVALPKKTRRGNVFTAVKKHYLREDVPCGHSRCRSCQSVSEQPLTAPEVFILDAETLFKHVTVLEEQVQDPHLTCSNTVFLQSSLLSIKQKDSKLYLRIKTFIDENNYFVFMNDHRKEAFLEFQHPDREFEASLKAKTWLESHLEGVHVCVVSTRQDPRTVLLEDVLKGSLLADMFPVTEPESPAIYQDHMEVFEAHLKVKEGLLYEGVMHVYRSEPHKAYVTVNKGVKNKLEIAILGHSNMNRALEGDLVAVEVLKQNMDLEQADLEEEDQVDLIETGKVSQVQRVAPLEGRVVSILSSKKKTYCGSIQATGCFVKNRELCMFLPVNPRIPQVKVYVSDKSRFENKRVTLVIDKWDAFSQEPQGHIVKVLGDIQDISTESDVILLEHDVVIKPFTQEAMNCLPSENWQLTQEEVSRRKDLRNRCVASVDPPGCKDIDDALHCTVLPNGNWEVGVHIADVTHFLEAGSALDIEASERCNTVYLVERRTDMLPALLTEKLCSLVGNTDRLAFSVLWEINPKTIEVVNVEFCKSVIHSRASLTYQRAQEIIDSESQDELACSLRRLLGISKVLRDRRFEEGALELASAEVKFELDVDRLQAKDMTLYQGFETNSMVEEFMLLANIAVARKILENYPAYSILRRHPPPKYDQLKQLSDTLSKLGYTLNYESSKALSESLKTITNSNNPYFNKIIRMQVTRCMNQAVYFCSSEYDRPEYSHYGLAAELYTHFTSPIRRYADVLVHRLLAAAIDVKSLPEKMTDRREMGVICRRMNFRNRMAQYSQRTSANLHTYLVFKSRAQKAKEEAVVVEMLPNGVEVMVPRIGLEGTVELEGFPSPDKMSFAYRGKTIQLYDRISVEIDIAFENFRKTIHIKLLE